MFTEAGERALQWERFITNDNVDERALQHAAVDSRWDNRSQQSFQQVHPQPRKSVRAAMLPASSRTGCLNRLTVPGQGFVSATGLILHLQCLCF